MRKTILPWTAGLGAAISLVISSCAYDPYYSSAGGHYGDGYGYGGSSFSTSLFVSTGDSRWGYDPHSYCYYDYRSRRYYDPYLYGYYPVGYRPYAVHGAPHPHGWRPGHGYCPPPQTVRNVTVVNYRDRESAYRKSNYNWAKQVKQRPSGDSYRPYSGRQTDYRTDSRTRYSNDRDSSDSRSRSDRETSRTRGYTPESYVNRGYSRPQTNSNRQQAVQSQYHQDSGHMRQEAPRTRSMEQSRSNRQYERPAEMRSRGGSQRSQETPSSRPQPQPKESSKPSGKSERGLRSLGDA